MFLQGSPGNLTDFEDVLGEQEGVNKGTLLAVKLGTKPTHGTKVLLNLVCLLGHTQHCLQHVAVACCDLERFSITVCEFCDGEHFPNLEARVSKKKWTFASGIWQFF